MSTASSTSNITSKAICTTQRAAENSIRRYLCLEAKYSALGLSSYTKPLLQGVRKIRVLASRVKDIKVRCIGGIKRTNMKGLTFNKLNLDGKMKEEDVHFY